MPTLLTIAEVASRLRVSARTVRRLIASGQIRPTYVGRRPLVSEDELRAFLAAAHRRGRSA